MPDAPTLEGQHLAVLLVVYRPQLLADGLAVSGVVASVTVNSMVAVSSTPMSPLSLFGNVTAVDSFAALSSIEAIREAASCIESFASSVSVWEDTSFSAGIPTNTTTNAPDRTSPTSRITPRTLETPL
ncbi:hypothetical protein GJ629_04370 [Halapricum sp. CBA1109]|uniref:hypothetical protein n=1 Tax=Halapricum sp. CBA1109 TaxID=2668068 RepID=UPI0012FC6CA7|nr:hypothetical protein [Halapricum sp. CBA1109]MUV89226.1 hypothetical protein [Halapricum sp. CBA1109]